MHEFKVTLIERGRIKTLFVKGSDDCKAMSSAKAEAKKLRYKVSEWLHVSLA